MLTAVEVIAPEGESLMLPLQDTLSGYVVEEIEGLDPVKATIVSSKFAKLDGTQRQSSYRESRNIVIKLGYEPDFVTNTVESLRDQLYDFLLPKMQTTLRFYKDGVAFVDIQGEVEDFMSPLFSAEPMATLSVFNFDPDFYALSSVVVPGLTTSGVTETTVPYAGNIETGFVLRLTVTAALSEFILYNTAKGNTYALEFSAPLLVGDVLTISTVAGNKYASVRRGGVDIPIMYGVSPSSDWLNLYKGPNKIRLSAAGVAQAYEIEYTTKYGGL